MNVKFRIYVSRWCERITKIWAAFYKFHFFSGKAAGAGAVAEKFLWPKVGEGQGPMAPPPLLTPLSASVCRWQPSRWYDALLSRPRAKYCCGACLCFWKLINAANYKKLRLSDWIKAFAKIFYKLWKKYLYFVLKNVEFGCFSSRTERVAGLLLAVCGHCRCVEYDLCKRVEEKKFWNKFC